MPSITRLFNPKNWFTTKIPEIPVADHDRRNGRRAIASVPRKRKADNDPLGPGRKRPRLEQNHLQHYSVDQLESGEIAKKDDPLVWTRFDIFDWLNSTWAGPGAQESSVAHASTITEFDAQTQLKATANIPSSKGEVVIKSPQSPATEVEATQAPGLIEMPPPPVPGRGYRTPVSQRQPRQIAVSHDSISELQLDRESTPPVPSSTVSKRSPPKLDGYNLEQARRHAAATQLPEQSGVWAFSEKQLFYHLSLRGFEPLLPENWMVDFKTLPLTLFANDNTDPPLIQPISGTEFRAVRALRDLVDTGKIVRDKSLAGPNFHAEKTIEKSVKEYFNWALSDANFDILADDYVPIYSIFTRKKGQTTATAISALNTRLRKLATRHRKRLGIVSSIESRSSPPTGFQDRTTQMYDDSPVYEPPVLVGILIVSSIFVIFTLNSYNSLASRAGARGAEDDLDNSGLRFIAKFDFSEAPYDVWNALAVAITAVHVRGHMERNRLPKVDKVKVKVESDAGVEEMSTRKRDSRGSAKAKSSGIGKEKGKQAVNSGWFNGEGYVESDPDL